MRALIVSCVFPPEPVLSSQMSGQLAGALLARGHEVTVITAYPSRPAGKLYSGYRRRVFERKRSPEGYDVVRIFACVSSESSMRSRFLENASFGATSSAVVAALPRADVVFANTWPIVASGLLASVVRARHVPLVLNVQDLYPESLVSQGRTKPTTLLARTLLRADRSIARSASDVVCISESFAKTYRESRGVPAASVHVVHNWIDAGSIVIDPAESRAMRVRWGVPDGAVLTVYGGNVGVGAGVETVLEALALLRSRDDIHCVIAGDGPSRSACEARARELGLRRVRFHVPWPASETSTVLGAADVLLLPTRGAQSAASLPSKLLAYMLSGRPVVALAMADSDLASLIERADAGWIVAPEAPQALARTLAEVADLDASTRRRRGDSARRYVLAHLTADACLPKLCAILERAATRGAHRPSLHEDTTPDDSPGIARERASPRATSTQGEPRSPRGVPC